MKLQKQVCIVCSYTQTKIFSYKDHHYFKCGKCGLITTYPLPDKKLINKHYKSKFEKGNYALLVKNRRLYMQVYENFADRIEKYFRQNGLTFDNKTVLDVGCFTGDFLEVMEKRGFVVRGIELQKEASRIANEKLSGKVLQMDVMSSKFPKKKYDVVSLSGLIEHVIEPCKLMKRIHKLLKQDGIIFIQTPNSSSYLARIMGKYWPPFTPIEHIHLFSKKSLRLFLENSGFGNVVFQRHVKKLPINYVYQNFKNFGPEFYSILKPFDSIIRNVHIKIPVYVGEIIVMAKKVG